MSDLDQKRGLPGNFVLFLIMTFFVILLMQNFLDIKTAKVSFSYQLEPLVNLDLLQPEDNRKTAINDNLVTFSGRFREHLTDDSKKRYKYLELLEESHDLSAEKQRIDSDLVTFRSRIFDSADLFLKLAGISIPAGGFVVIDNIDRSIEGEEAVTVQKLSAKSTPSLPRLNEKAAALAKTPTESGADELGSEINEWINLFRSPLLGVGSEKIKEDVRRLQKSVVDTLNSELPPREKMDVWGETLDELNQLVKEMTALDGSARLVQLRAVRNFQDAQQKYSDLFGQIESNRVQLQKAEQAVQSVVWFVNGKELSTKALNRLSPEDYKQWFTQEKEEWNGFEKNRGGYFKAPDQPLNSVLEKKFRSEEPPPKYLSYFFPALLAFSVLVVLYALFARQMKGVGGGAMNFGKSPARLIQPSAENRVTFKDVAGIDESLEELQEIVEFLKNPKKFTTLGGRIPKGVLCIGSPGTGKTLIAKAVAGEAERPFFSISGSDFVEMFVGVGASRIRDLFDQAKKSAPCIIFIDEIDAVGRHRGAGIGGGHDEREQTLNQLLVEMDGFDTNEGVIIMAATNRPDVLDKALLRPGRFDRHVVIPLPDIKGRFEILKVHARKIKMDTSVDLMILARGTPGSSGADLANMLNEAALLAARRGRTAVTMQEVMEARDKVLYGKERRSLELDENEKKTTAYHEAGHTVVGLVVEHADPVERVTIIPRGFSLGSTMFLPTKNKVSYWKRELIDRLAVLMGGRCAEDIFVHDISSGAKQDIEHATHLARSMVCEWGMSEKLGTVAYDEKSEAGAYLGSQGFHEKKYSEATAQSIDEEVRQILDEANKTAHRIIEEHREEVELMAKLLIDYETLDSEDLAIIMEGRWDDAEKKLRIKKQEDLNKKQPAVPPPPPEEEEKPSFKTTSERSAPA